MITGWDPGLTVGWAIWSKEGVLLNMGDCPLDQTVATWQWLESTYGTITVAVVEDFRLFHRRARQQSGSNMPASQGIGMLKAMAEVSKSEFVIQAPNKKSIAMKWAGIKALPANHDETHKYDAYLHGFYYMHAKGIVKSALQQQKEAERGNS